MISTINNNKIIIYGLFSLIFAKFFERRSTTYKKFVGF